MPESSQSIWKPLFWLVLASLIAVYLLYNHHSDQLQAEIGNEHQSQRSLSRSLEATKDQLAKAEQALKAAQAEISALKSNHAEQLETVKGEHQAATAAMQQSHEQRLAELSEQIDDFSNEKTLLTAETEAWKRAKDKLEQDLRQAADASAELEARLADTAEKRRELEVKLAADDDTIAELNALLNRANQTEALLSDKLERGAATQERLEMLVEKEESAILELQDKLVATTQSRAELERLLATSNAESSAPDQATGSAEPGPEKAALQARIDQLEADLEAITTERDEIAAANAANQPDNTENQAMAELREQFEAERSALETQLAEAKMRIDGLLTELETERDALGTQLAEAKAQHEDARAAALAEAEQELDAVRKQLAQEKDAAIADLKENQGETHAKTLAEAKQRIDSLGQELEAEREAVAQQGAAHRQELTQLRAELDEAKGALDALKQSLSARDTEHQSKSADYEAQLAEAEAALEAMRREMQEQEKALQSARERGTRLSKDAAEQASDEVHDFYDQFAPLGAQLTDRGLLVNLSSENIRFPSGSALLPEDAGSTLSRIAKILVDHPDLRVQIEGHTDSSGNSQINLQLSEQRAASVRDALVERGVEPARLSIEGLGSSAPIASNATNRGRERNRRVELYVVREDNS